MIAVSCIYHKILRLSHLKSWTTRALHNTNISTSLTMAVWRYFKMISMLMNRLKCQWCDVLRKHGWAVCAKRAIWTHTVYVSQHTQSQCCSSNVSINTFVPDLLGFLFCVWQFYSFCLCTWFRPHHSWFNNYIMYL